MAVINRLEPGPKIFVVTGTIHHGSLTTVNLAA